MRIFALPLALLLSSAVQADTIYKCPGADGKLVFSDKPCASGGEVINYSHPESFQQKLERERAESRAQHEANMQQIQLQADARRLAVEKINRESDRQCESRLAQAGLTVGMSKQAVLDNSLWSFPDDTSKTTAANGVVEHWTYDCKGYKSVRLLIVNERLSSIHQ